MKPWTERTTYLVGTLALIGGAFAAQPGCGGSDAETTNDTTCSPACGADQECIGGLCQCRAGTTSCSGVCVDTNADTSNCGDCGTQCAEFEVCVGGTCQCPEGMASCSSGCADLNTDKLNCGQCNIPCRAAQSCEGGSCVCPDNKVLCFDQCVDTTSDSYFCGDCNTPCEDGEYCNGGTCEIISNCDQVAMDQYEGNDTCALARPLPLLLEGTPTPVTVSDPTLHHTDHSLDTDWYSILAKEGTHDCSFLSGQCYFVFDIAFAPPDEAAHDTYEMCVSSVTCGAGEICTTAGDWNASAGRYELALQWKGTCFLTDDRLFFVAIKRNDGQESCEQYTLEYQMSYTDEVCP